MTAKIKRPGRGWAYACAQLGGAASIAANIAHSFVPPAGAPEGWAPPAGAVISSVFWPAALFAAIEAFARVDWPDRKRWVWLRFGGLLPVATVAAVVSYMHLSGLLDSYGAGPFEVHVGPLAVDGLMVIGTAALIATSRVRRAKETDQVDQTPAPLVPVTVARDEISDLVGDEPATTPELWERYAGPIGPPMVEEVHTIIEPDPRFVWTGAEPDQETDQVDEPVDQVAARRRSDDELWIKFGDQMCKEHIAAEDGITQYRVGKITNTDRRQAKRLQARVIETVGVPEEATQ